MNKTIGSTDDGATGVDERCERLAIAPWLAGLDYFSARERFRQLGRQLGWELQAWPVEGEPAGRLSGLTVDTAFHDRSAPVTLIVSSGLHGVEGPFGSAVLQRFFQAWMAMGLQPRVNVLAIHALNPYGYVCGRRTDGLNRDLNRNFLLADEVFGGAPELYRRLNRYINPSSPPPRLDVSLVAAPWILGRYGMRRVSQALAEGQYEFPSGLFYGGAGPAGQREILAAILGRALRDSTLALHLDLHTGLGNTGQCMLICDHPLQASQREQIEDWFPGHAIRVVAGQQTAYAARGSLGRWIHAQRFCPDYRYLCVEVGTRPAISVFLAMRAENRAHYWADPNTSVYQRAKIRMWDAFYPRRRRWAAEVIPATSALIQHALSRLAQV